MVILGFRVQGLGFMVRGSGAGFEFGTHGFRFRPRVHGLGSLVCSVSSAITVVIGIILVRATL